MPTIPSAFVKSKRRRGKGLREISERKERVSED